MQGLGIGIINEETGACGGTEILILCQFNIYKHTVQSLFINSRFTYSIKRCFQSVRLVTLIRHMINKVIIFLTKLSFVATTPTLIIISWFSYSFSTISRILKNNSVFEALIKHLGLSHTPRCQFCSVFIFRIHLLSFETHLFLRNKNNIYINLNYECIWHI